MATAPIEARRLLAEIDPEKLAVTVWKDGTWKAWGAMDAFYARADDNWLVDFSLAEIVTTHEDEFPGTER
jgi:hypothetical protein